MSKQESRLLRALVIVALLAYALPWTVARSAPLTLNAYDLAEWTSLHPAQRATSPPLSLPLLLRAQLLILSLLIGLAASPGKSRFGSALAILLLSFGQLPPFEFVYDPNNLNYRQQFFLALGSLIAGMALLPGWRRRPSRLIALALAGLGVVCALLAASGALAFFADAGPRVELGAGPSLMVAACLGMCALALGPVLLDALRRRWR